MLLCVWLLQGCRREPLPGTDEALRLVLLKGVSSERLPQSTHEAVHCLAFLDTARNPPPRLPQQRDLEWERLCESERQGRVRDPEPWVIPSLRKEFLLSPPDMRPFSRCSQPTLMTRDEWERTRLVLVERMEQTTPDSITITLQIRNLCKWAEQGEESWGYGMDCFVRRDKQGQWKFTGCQTNVII